MPEKHPFLTAEWRYLLMLNYEVDPAVLEPLLPAGTMLDLWMGKALVSMVGFLFQKTRVLGLPVPFHTNFEEVNLRFYVRQAASEDAEAEPRRGVVFVKEIVPRLWIARVANWMYGEKYAAMPMRHTIEKRCGQLCKDGLVEYAWRFRGRLQRMGALAQGDAQPLIPDSEESFITEHYWGYTRRGAKHTGTYRVAHPAWNVWQVTQPYLLCDLQTLYGKKFEEFLRRRPRSAFLAEGSAVEVYPEESRHYST